jgi:release factor glutamine methyltransferase
MITLKEHFKSFVHKISQVYSIEEAKSIAFLVFEHFLKVSKMDILTDARSEIKVDLDTVVSRILNHEPIQYIISEADFYGMKFKVDANTLIPRNETEELVALALKKINGKQPNLKVLDIGTGSGCIAISIAKNNASAQVTAWDISEKALEMAQKNAELNQVKVKFERKDILNIETVKPEKFDLIVSNPPYVTESEIKQMQRNVLDFEPHLALFVEDTDPLLFYKKIADFASKSLSENGVLIVEINEQFGFETQKCFLKAGLKNCEIIKDIHGKNRFVIANH